MTLKNDIKNFLIAFLVPYVVLILIFKNPLLAIIGTAVVVFLISKEKIIDVLKTKIDFKYLILSILTAISLFFMTASFVPKVYFNLKSSLYEYLIFAAFFIFVFELNTKFLYEKEISEKFFLVLFLRNVFFVICLLSIFPFNVGADRYQFAFYTFINFSYLIFYAKLKNFYFNFISFYLFFVFLYLFSVNPSYFSFLSSEKAKNTVFIVSFLFLCVIVSFLEKKDK
jgi:hypothetical protein